MRMVRMPKTGLKVSELCFGTLTLGTLQANLPPQEGAKAVRKALELGVTFFDTAQSYGSYPHLREGLVGATDELIVVSRLGHIFTDEVSNITQIALVGDVSFTT